MKPTAKSYWTTRITPSDSLLAVDWREIWRYRDLFVLFVDRNFRTAYKQTILGPLWFIITPVLSVFVYVAVFGGIANIPTDGVPPVLFYLLGIAVWSYFASCLNATSNSFVANADIFGKVYFPRIIMPLVAVTTNLLTLAIQLAIFVAFYLGYVLTGTALTMHWQVVLFPFLILLLALMAVGFGMIFSSLTTKYRDLQIMLTKLIALWRDSVGWRFAKRIKKDTILDLNRCDTTELQYIRGIGHPTAIQIIRYREQLGGFYSPEQLKDEYLSSYRLDTLLTHFTADTNDVLVLPVNSCSIDRLKNHPYLRYNQAKAIYVLRRQRIRLQSIDDLRSLPEMTEDDLRRLAPYLSFE